jgi:DnaJ family protein A protein 2
LFFTFKMELYKTLGIEKNASPTEVKKAYFGLAKIHHPDKGGDPEAFKKIQHAYDILIDEQKRGFYDQTGQIPGEQEIDPGMQGGGAFPFDLGGLFGMFGGGGGPFGGAMPFGPGGPRMHRGPPSANRRGKAPPKVHEVNITLADFYHGRSIKITFERQKFCTACRGDGHASFQSCDACKGSGMINRIMTMGPGMQMMSSNPCAACQGTGQKPGAKCGSCQGKCFTNESKTLDIIIEPGMKAGERLVFPGECSDTQEFAEAGDVHILLCEADEEIPWKRDGQNLRATLAVNLRDSLLGSLQKIGQHPGYSTGCEIAVPKGSLNAHTVVVKGAGMPVRGTDRKGDALITLQVSVMPSEQQAIEKNIQLLMEVFKI